MQLRVSFYEVILELTSILGKINTVSVANGVICASSFTAWPYVQLEVRPYMPSEMGEQ